MLFAVLLLLLAIIGADVVLQGAIRRVLRPALIPVAALGKDVMTALASQDVWSSRQTLIKENTALRRTIEILQARDAGYSALQNEYEALKAIAHVVGGEVAERGVTAPVVSSFRASPYGTFIIGAGSKDGVRNNDIAVCEGGFVIGSVSDVNANSAVVKMIFAPGRQSEVVVRSTGFSLRGRGSGNASADTPRESDLKEGDFIIAPEYGRPVGIIEKIESDSSSAYATIFAVFPLNLNTVRHVYIVPGIDI